MIRELRSGGGNSNIFPQIALAIGVLTSNWLVLSGVYAGISYFHPDPWGNDTI